MEKLTICRICLSEDVGLGSNVNNELQEFYQELTSQAFQTEDRRPMVMCYICLAQLRRAYTFKLDCLAAEQLFAQILDGKNERLETLELSKYSKVKLLTSVLVQVRIDSEFCEDSSNPVDLDTAHVKQEMSQENDPFLDVEDTKDHRSTPDLGILHDSDGLIPAQFNEDILKLEADANDHEVTPVIKRTPEKDDQTPLVKKTKLNKEMPVMPTKLDGNIKVEGTSNRKIDTEVINSVSRNKQGDNILKCIINDQQCHDEIIKHSECHSRLGDSLENGATIPSELKAHGITHGEKLYKCVKCEKNYLNRSSLERHFRVVHPGEKRYECDECDLAFEQLHQLNNHTRQHTGEKRFKCNTCPKDFPSRIGLSNHMRTHTVERPNELYKCDMCEKNYISISGLKTHMRVAHTDEKRYKCDKCDLAFKQSYQLKRHTHQHTGEKPYRCNTCLKDFSYRTALINHMRTHTGERPNELYKCDKCEKNYLGISGLKTHMRVAHTDEKRYKCDKCDLAFKQSYQLKRHTHQHTGEKPFKCNTCLKDFSCRTALINHMRTHTGEKPFKCDQCWKAFTQSYHLLIHIRTHTGEKPYKCKTCLKCFSQPNQLKNHVRLHTGEKPYKCNICPTAFVQRYPWVLHMRTHTGEKPYPCDVCQKRFKCPQDLRKHSVTHTGEKPFVCNICQRDFGRRKSLRRHERNVHKVLSKAPLT